MDRLARNLDDYGAYRGRKKSLSDSEIAELRQRAAAGEKKTTLASNRTGLYTQVNCVLQIGYFKWDFGLI